MAKEVQESHSGAQSGLRAHGASNRVWVFFKDSLGSISFRCRAKASLHSTKPDGKRKKVISIDDYARIVSSLRRNQPIFLDLPISREIIKV